MPSSSVGRQRCSVGVILHLCCPRSTPHTHSNNPPSAPPASVPTNTDAVPGERAREIRKKYITVTSSGPTSPAGAHGRDHRMTAAGTAACRLAPVGTRLGPAVGRAGRPRRTLPDACPGCGVGTARYRCRSDHADDSTPIHGARSAGKHNHCQVTRKASCAMAVAMTVLSSPRAPVGA